MKRTKPYSSTAKVLGKKWNAIEGIYLPSSLFVCLASQADSFDGLNQAKRERIWSVPINT